MFNFKKLLALLIAALCFSSGVSQAVPITYRESAVITGTLGGQAVEGLLIITGTGDTSTVSGGGTFFSNSVTTNTFTLGVLSGSLTGSGYEWFVNQTYPAVGIGGSAGSFLDTVSGLISSYDLTTAIGPITDNPFIRTDLFFSTSLGDLNIRSAGQATFEALINTVPEPASMALVLVALAGVAASKRRKSLQ